jgi:SAM-dependent methyltransferase
MRIRRWLAHPLTRGLDIDDPRTTHLRQRIIQEKKSLRHIYEEWYSLVAGALPPGEGHVVELGSGGGFMSEFLPGLITSEVFPCPDVKLVMNGMQMPFLDGVLSGIVMTGVLHHIPDTRRFFADAARCLRMGGVIAMIEPWSSLWSRFVYSRLHYEPFEPKARDWGLPVTIGPLSGANLALPWIVFERDRARFEREFPELQIRAVRPMMPFRYLVSGGVSTRSLIPGWTFAYLRRVERILQPWMRTWAMFAHIVLVKGQTPHSASSACPL